ncbi:hypothetical protein E2C01_041237 [Portunus trituberculatus]|uniref:Uncharacterized protein n=1 Tax=Portunus trituberculatus TaxID=210409 RepID=A0A5B7FRD7_PORTR|nr:hypothetical protein [Portunus trituberculatus]
MRHCDDERAAEDGLARRGCGNFNLAEDRRITWGVGVMMRLVTRTREVYLHPQQPITTRNRSHFSTI